MSKYDNFSREELIELLQKRDKELSLKKYGLVWDSEKEPEKVVVDCAKKLPILKSVPEKDIKTTDDDYNIMIEGDNYHALQVLNYTHKEKIDVIYIDPPYNTGNKDFVYNDKFVDKEDGYRHSKWLNFMEKRLELAKELLKDDGIIFVSIDDNEGNNLRLLCDKIFGEINFIENFIWVKNSGGSLSKTTLTRHEYILCYAKNKLSVLDSSVFYIKKNGYDMVTDLVKKCKRSGKSIQEAVKQLKSFYKQHTELKGISLYDHLDENWNIYRLLPITAPNNNFYDVLHPVTHKPVVTPPRGWSWSRETMEENIKKGKVVFGKDETYTIAQKLYLDDAKYEHKRSTINSDQAEGNKLLGEIFGDTSKFNNPKPVSILEYILYNTDKRAVILDFFAGSGTTAQAVLNLNKQDNGTRRFILCTNNEGNIATAVCYPRVQKIINGYKKNGDGEFIDGLGGNLKYFRTDFVENSKNTTQTKINLARECSDMISLKTGRFNQISIKNSSFKIFSNNKNDQYTCIYFDCFDTDIQSFIKEISKLNGKKDVYIFSLTDLVDNSLFKGIADVKLEAIPYKILDLYRRIAKAHIKGSNHD